MPLPFRTVEPVHVSRGTLPERIRIRNELEGAANGTLANVIRQLSSLSQGAEEIFGDLIAVGTGIAARANNLQARIDRLAVKVVQMDATPEESASMQDSLNSKPFISSMLFDQQVVARQSLPMGMTKIYQICDRPPPLDKLNKYRDDGKDGLKFYTDPSYFFELWRQDMLKDTERAMYDKVKKPHKPKNEHGQRHKKRVRQPNSTRDKHRHVAIEQGEHIMQRNHHQDPRDAQARMYAEGGIRPQQSHVQIPNHLDYRHEPEYNTNDAYRNQLAQQRGYEAYNNVNQQHVNNQQQRYYPQQVNSPPPPYESPSSYARQNSSQRSLNQSMTNVNGYGVRPTQPPPAPPPVYSGTPPSSQIGTPTRSSNMRTSMSNRETLPPPPPPPIEQQQQQQQTHQQNGYLPSSAMNGYAHHDNFQNHMPQGYNNVYDRNHLEILPPPIVSFDQNDEPLPPPPPTPDQNMAAALGMMGHHLRPPSSIPEEHLPPSPPPPPPEDNFPIPIAPPPPPPPPPLPLPNGTDGMDGVKPRESRKSPKPAGSESGPKRILPMGGGMMDTWDGRSELLKAIRDGIELRKVERKEPGKEEKTNGMYHDVASILARRVAVEMSDSESGSDSEYDSDGWGDETSA